VIIILNTKDELFATIPLPHHHQHYQFVLLQQPSLSTNISAQVIHSTGGTDEDCFCRLLQTGTSEVSSEVMTVWRYRNSIIIIIIVVVVDTEFFYLLDTLPTTQQSAQSAEGRSIRFNY